jgi:signal peptidase
MAPAGASGSAFKDVILAIAIVMGVLGGLFLYTGVWPPMVVVESGSMMHGVTCPPPVGQPDLCDTKVGYGKFGTIDPGDMVFVKRVTKREEAVPMAEARAKNPEERNYGKPGDVLVYFPFNQRTNTPIIHRAIGWVEVAGVAQDCERSGNPGAQVSYQVFWDGRQNNFGSSGIFLPAMGFGPPHYSEDNGYKPCWSGYITKGDNPVTNRLPDQAQGGSRGTRGLPNQPIELSWVEGKAVGELPWFGLIKLALSGQSNYANPCLLNNIPLWQPNDPACENGKAVLVLSAWAPADLWVMLGVSLALIAIVPLGYDLLSLRQQRERAAKVARGEDPGPTLTDQVRLRLGLEPKDARDGGPPPAEPPAEPPPEEGADPSRAFEPPRTGSGDAGTKGPTKFERVERK